MSPINNINQNNDIVSPVDASKVKALPETIRPQSIDRHRASRGKLIKPTRTPTTYIEDFSIFSPGRAQKQEEKK